MLHRKIGSGELCLCCMRAHVHVSMHGKHTKCTLISSLFLSIPFFTHRYRDQKCVYDCDGTHVCECFHYICL